MSTFIIRRLFMGMVVLFLVTLVVFFSLRLMPGDPILIFLAQSQQGGGGMSAEQMDVMRAEYGLDKPVLVQYVNWVAGIFRGDLGRSIHYREDVGRLLLDRFPITLHLAAVSLVLSTGLGIWMGLVAAMRRGTWIDTLVTVLSYTGLTVPVFWLGMLLIYFFSLKLGWLPIAGYTSPFKDFGLNTQQIIMPVICLSVMGLASTARQMRSSVLSVANQDYIRTAWSKGLTEKVIVTRHILKNSLIPVITLLGVTIGMVIGGSVLVENVFAIPGIGRLLVTSIFAQDYVVIQSGTLVIATIIVLVNLIVDISYGWFDPRIRIKS